jgi:hypothetical protein
LKFEFRLDAELSSMSAAHEIIKRGQRLPNAGPSDEVKGDRREGEDKWNIHHRRSLLRRKKCCLMEFA